MRFRDLLSYIFVVIFILFLASLVLQFNCSGELLNLRTWLGIGACLPPICYFLYHILTWFEKCLNAVCGERSKASYLENNFHLAEDFLFFFRICWVYIGFLVYLGIEQCDPGFFGYRFKIQM